MWGLFRDRILTHKGFQEDGESVLLGKVARRRFYERFHPLGIALRRLLRRQMRVAARGFEETGRMVLTGRFADDEAEL